MFGKYTIVKKAEIAMFEELIEDLREEKHALESRAEQANCRAEELAAMVSQERVAKLAAEKRAVELNEMVETQRTNLEELLQQMMQLTLDVEELERENALLAQRIDNANKAANDDETVIDDGAEELTNGEELDIDVSDAPVEV